MRHPFLASTVAALGLATLAACGTPGARPVAPVGAVLVPDHEGGVWSFGTNTYAHRSGRAGRAGGDEAARPRDGVGAPLAAASDPGRGWSVVVYPASVASYTSLVGDVVWSPIEPLSGVPRVATANELLAVVDDRDLRLYRLGAGAQPIDTWSVADWIAETDATRLVGAVPASATELVLIGERAPSSFGANGAVVVDRVDASSGRLLSTQPFTREILTSVQQVVNVGDAVFVAGQKEVYPIGGEPLVTFVVLRYDAEERELREKVVQPQYDRRAFVRDVLVDTYRDEDGTVRELLAILSSTGLAQVYRVPLDGTATEPIYDRVIEGATSMAWAARGELVFERRGDEPRRVVLPL